MTLLVATIALVLTASPVLAQEQPRYLRTANTVFVASAATDWTMTSIFLAREAATEVNPLLQWTDNHPAATVAAGVAMDAAGLWAWNRFVGRTHPKWAAVGLYAQAAVRVWFVARGAHALDVQSRGGR